MLTLYQCVFLDEKVNNKDQNKSGVAYRCAQCLCLPECFVQRYWKSNAVRQLHVPTKEEDEDEKHQPFSNIIFMASQ